jgi:hypothetical protein
MMGGDGDLLIDAWIDRVADYVERWEQAQTKSNRIFFKFVV